MLKNDEMQQEFALFGDIWKMLKALLPVGDKTDEAYWDEVVSQTKAIMSTYPGQLASDLSLAVLGELERRCEANEDQDTGCKPVP